MTSRPADRWFVVASYAAVGAANQMLWLTFAPITTDAAHHFDVSVDAIGWLSELFPLLYVVLAVPAAWLLERRFVTGLMAGAVLEAVGAVIRLSGGYDALLAGQILVAIAQPLILGAVTVLVARSVSQAKRPTGIAVASAGLFAGMLIALVTGAAIGAANADALLALQAALTCAAVAMLIVAVATNPLPADVVVAGEPLPGVRDVVRDRPLRLLICIAAVGFGVFVALTTWLQALLDPAGVSAAQAGTLLLALVIAGVVCGAVIPPWVARRGLAMRFIAMSVLVTAAACLALAVAPGYALALVGSIAIGAVLLTDLPILLTFVEERAGNAGAVATGLVWLAGNAFGLVTALVVQAMLDVPWLAFTTMAVIVLAALPLLRMLAPLLDQRGDSARANSVQVVDRRATP